MAARKTTGRRPHARADKKQRKAPPKELPKEVRKAQALTMSIPDAGRIYLGLSKNSSYQAAEDGVIPFVKVGGKMRVPVRAMERLLDKAEPAAAERAAAAAERKAAAANVSA